MSTLRKATAAAAVLGLALVGWAMPASSVDSAPAGGGTGYTVVSNDSGCELATVDLRTGALTDLPAAPSEAACAVDLAVSPAGTVYGVSFESFRGTSLDAQATSPAELITFAADGTPTTKPLVDEGADNSFLAEGGIAVSAGGTLYVHLVTNNPACDAEGTTGTTVVSPLYAGDSVCLFTVDPATGAATIVGTTGLYQTPFWQLAWCGELTTIALPGNDPADARWATESSSSALVTEGASVDTVPLGYDCDSTKGAPLYGLTSPDTVLPGPAASQVAVVTIDPDTGDTTVVAPLSDPAADVLALAVVPSAAPTPTTQPPAVAADTVVPAFTG